MQSFEKSWPRLARATVTGLTVLVTICFAGSFARAATISPGTVLPNYAIVSVGSSASIMINSGPITGKVLVGFGSTTSASGGGGGLISGGVDNSVLAGSPTGGCGASQTTCFSMLNTAPMVTVVSESIGATAFADAATLSAEATTLGLNPTQTFGNITASTTIHSTGLLNVINITGEKNATLTIEGGPNDIFIFNVSGSINTNHPIILQGGVTASHILWNLTGSGTVLQTSGGDVLVGTFLATKPKDDFQFSALNITGQLIDTTGHIQFVSNSKLTAAPFTGEELAPVPEPSSLFLFGTGLVAGAGVLRRKAAARFRQCAMKVFGAEPMQVSELAPSGANRSE